MRSISNRTALLAKSPLELIQVMSYPNLSALLEAIVYLAKEPVSLDDIHAAVPEVDAIEIERTLKEFIKTQIPPTRLSLAALETLAVIAYKQPVTVPEIQDIRGVHASSVIKTLLDKKLITTAGRKEVLGRPILYKTTKEFLIHFGLKDLAELPSMEEFEELIKAQAGAEEEIISPS